LRITADGGRRLSAQPAIVIAALVVTVVSLDIVTRGRNELDAKRPDNNYGLDDRRSIRFVLRARQPGDPVLTTHFGLAGLWWYGGVDISDPSRAGFLGDSPIFEIAHEADEERCTRHRDDMDALAARTGRAIVYLGFRMNVEPEGFDKLVLGRARQAGRDRRVSPLRRSEPPGRVRFQATPERRRRPVFYASEHAANPATFGLCCRTSRTTLVAEVRLKPDTTYYTELKTAIE
jgi:hypothetical protein